MKKKNKSFAKAILPDKGASLKGPKSKKTQAKPRVKRKYTRKTQQPTRLTAYQQMNPEEVREFVSQMAYYPESIAHRVNGHADYNVTFYAIAVYNGPNGAQMPIGRVLFSDEEMRDAILEVLVSYHPETDDNETVAQCPVCNSLDVFRITAKNENTHAPVRQNPQHAKVYCGRVGECDAADDGRPLDGSEAVNAIDWLMNTMEEIP
jgi:hypothetical protein